MFTSVSLALLLGSAMPAYLRALPWNCQNGGQSEMRGAHFDNLAVCKPNGAPKLEPFVQAVADALGNAGHPPRLRFGPHGPHLYAIDGTRVISATFVQDSASKKFDVWISMQELRPEADLPALPAGVEWVTAHQEPSGQRLVALRLDASLRNSQALLAATFAAIGAEQLSGRNMEAPLPALSGSLKWGNERGFYHLIEIDPRASYLTLYTSGAVK